MKGALAALASGLLRAKAVSPAGFVRGAAILLLLFGAAHLAGLRVCVGMLSLTVPPGWSAAGAEAGACVYLVLWFLAVAAAPVLLLGAGLFTLLLRWPRRVAP